MHFIGKSAPTTSRLAEAHDRGFDAIEVYLTTTDIAHFDETADALSNAAVDIISIHTPHVTIDQLAYLRRTDELAQHFNATLVIHSGKIGWWDIPAIEALDLNADRAYENPPGVTTNYTERCLFDQNHRLVFDIAHHALGHNHSEQAITDFLANYATHIDIIHYCDATEHKDGVPFTQGLLDRKEILTAIDTHYDGPVVVEVFPEHQQDELEATQAALNELNN